MTHRLMIEVRVEGLVDIYKQTNKLERDQHWHFFIQSRVFHLSRSALLVHKYILFLKQKSQFPSHTKVRICGTIGLEMLWEPLLLWRFWGFFDVGWNISTSQLFPSSQAFPLSLVEHHLHSRGWRIMLIKHQNYYQHWHQLHTRHPIMLSPTAGCCWTT